MNQSEPGPGAPASVDPVEPHPEMPACALVSGAGWKGYRIEKPAMQAPGICFEAVRLDNLEPVFVRAGRLDEATEWRRGAWQRLAELEDVAIVGLIEAIEEEGWRYEVTRRPPASTLLEWFACHQAGYESVESLTRQLAAVLDALHAQGVVHLNLRPDTVFVDSSEGALRIVVGGLHEATLYTQSIVELAEVDPLYAPPEAAGRLSFPPGTGLCAWDWWSVGRIVQQFLLGRHVAAVLNPEAAKDAGSLRAAAEKLMCEREPPGTRAGAVEAMGKIDPVIRTLLQGLLTSVREARWSGVEVRRWLARETVGVQYEMPTGARLFVWKERGLTPVSAAGLFSGEEAWEDGEFNLFSPEDPATLLAFLRSEPSHAATLALVQKHLDWLEHSEWSEVPPIVRRTIVAGVVWMTLAQSQGQRASLTLRGRRVDAAGLVELFDAVGAEAAVALARGLSEPHFVDRLAPLDPEAATMLSGLAALGGEARKQAVAEGWIEPADDEAHVRILCLALESKTALAVRIDKLRSQYATSRLPSLARLFAERSLPDWTQVLLAYTGERAARFGYVTHGQWKRERLISLNERAARAATAIFWLRLQRLLRAGFVATVPWKVAGMVAAAFLAVGGIVADRPGLAVVAAALLVAGRWYVPRVVARWVSLHDPSAGPWTDGDGWRRCAAEAARLAPDLRTLPELSRELAEIGAARVELAPTAPALPPLVELRPLWSGFSAATATVVVLGGYFLHAATPRFVAFAGEMRSPVEAVVASADEETAAGPRRGEEAGTSGEFEYVDEGFGRRLRGPLERWSLHAPAAPVEPLPVAETRPATAWQRAHALVSLELLLLPYARDSVHALIAVRVPSSGGGPELMILNSRSRRPFRDDALRLSRELDERTWYQHDRGRVVFLGEPPSLSGDFSLAPE